MKPINKLTIAVCTTLLSTSTLSASIDIRHEYKHSSEQHATRVKMNESINNLYFSGELKFKGKDGEFLEDLQNNGWEFDWGYRVKLNDNWTLIPGMPVEGRSSGMTYKPQLRVTYAFDNVEGLTLSGRYRYDMYQNNNTDDKRRHRLTGNLGYKYEKWSFGLEANYYKADDYELFKDKETDVEYNSTIRRTIGQWSPYVEFGYISYKDNGGFDIGDGSTTNNDYELRSRIGVSYSF